MPVIIRCNAASTPPPAMNCAMVSVGVCWRAASNSAAARVRSWPAVMLSPPTLATPLPASALIPSVRSPDTSPAANASAITASTPSVTNTPTRELMKRRKKRSMRTPGGG